MKKMIFPAIVFMALLFTSCSSVPQIQIDSANAAVEAAKAVEADLYVPQEYQMLVDSLNDILASIETEKTESVGSRDFKPYVEKLNNLVAQAENVKVNAETQKAQVRIEVQDAIVSLTNLVAENKEIIQKTPVTNKTKADLESMQNELTMIEASISELNTLVNNGDYLTALAKVKESNRKVVAMNETLKTKK